MADAWRRPWTSFATAHARTGSPGTRLDIEIQRYNERRLKHGPFVALPVCIYMAMIQRNDLIMPLTKRWTSRRDQILCRVIGADRSAAVSMSRTLFKPSHMTTTLMHRMFRADVVPSQHQQTGCYAAYLAARAAFEAASERNISRCLLNLCDRNAVGSEHR